MRSQNHRGCGMSWTRFLLLSFILSSVAAGQVRKIIFPANSPEDQALQAIAQEQDAAARLEKYRKFLADFASSPEAVAYGRLQIAQHFLSAGDARQALSEGEQASALVPNNLDILSTLVTIAQQLNDPAKIMEYAARGGEAINGIVKQPRPENATATPEEWLATLEAQREGLQSSYEFLEVAAFNAVANQADATARMALIERFNAAFPDSRYAPQVAQYAIYSLQLANKFADIAAYATKVAGSKNPTTLALLANALAEDPKGVYVARSVEYARQAIELCAAASTKDDPALRMTSGLAHSALGYALMKQEKTTAAITALRTAMDLLRDDPASYSTVLYRLGFAYAKQKRYPEAQQVLNQAVRIEGPFQQPARDLLAKVNAASARQ